jgi:hypothetical protein
MFKIHEKYVIRHKILEYLNSKIVYYENSDKVINLNDTNTPFQEVVDAIGVPFKKAYKYHHALHIKDEEHVLCSTHDKIQYIGIKEDGIAAAIDEYWLREGQKELNERIYDKTKWVVPILALIITAISLSYSAYTTRQSSNKVELIRLELEKLKRQNTPSVGTSVQQGH